MELRFKPIGVVRSPYKERFGIPRQPAMVRSAKSVLKLSPELRGARETLRGLEGFSHVWLVFVFHESAEKWNPLVRPPRLGGARKVGVFASRSPHRPNPIGISVVELESIHLSERGGPELVLRGADLMDGTPVLDIKPYIPYADSRPRAKLGWADQPLVRKKVSFSRGILGLSAEEKRLIREVLAQDPRPAFQRESSAEYSMRILDRDVHWQAGPKGFVVTSVDRLA